MLFLLVNQLYFAALVFAQIDALMESSNKAASMNMQQFILFLLFILGGIVLWQNREAKKAARKLADDAAAQHREIVEKQDAERVAMNVERLNRMDNLMTVIRDNTLSFAKNATATDDNTRVIAELAVLIRDRIPAGRA